jgi:hypothetical protein
MNKPLSYLLLGLSFAATAVPASAQEKALASQPTPPVIQVAVAHAPAPEMTHEVASLMQTLKKAQAQYRRSGTAQDYARVQAMHRELASRGFGRATTPAPALMAQTDEVLHSEQAVRVSSAQ